MCASKGDKAATKSVEFTLAQDDEKHPLKERRNLRCPTKAPRAAKPHPLTLSPKDKSKTSPFTMGLGKKSDDSVRWGQKVTNTVKVNTYRLAEPLSC